MSESAKHISGTVPTSLASTLQILDADYSSISGQSPSQLFGKLDRLRSAGFASTSLSSAIPTEFGLQWLTRARFTNTSISGSIPSQLGVPKGLRLFDASYTRLSGSVPTELFDKTRSLETLNLYNTSLSGTLPTYFATLGSLRKLYIPRSLTQYLRAKYCRQELHLPMRFNYFWDLAAAAIDGRSQVSSCPRSCLRRPLECEVIFCTLIRP